jgi:hypothetical protein
MRLHATFDHRFVDGYHAGVLARAMRRLLSDPAQLDPKDTQRAGDGGEAQSKSAPRPPVVVS